MTSKDCGLDISSTRGGFRLAQHGVVLSELRITPGPTHSVFDVLAAAVFMASGRGPVGLLGFAGGGIMAPLRAIGFKGPVDSVDLDRTGHDLFRKHCSSWSGTLNWTQADAVKWLHHQPQTYSVLVEDLSVSVAADVIKPDISWDVMPELISKRLASDGLAIFNLLPTPGRKWCHELKRVASIFNATQVITLDEFENRILLCASDLPPARRVGAQLRKSLRSIRSSQAGRLHVREL